MSVCELLNPDIKSWANLYVTSINIQGSGGTGGGSTGDNASLNSITFLNGNPVVSGITGSKILSSYQSVSPALTATGSTGATATFNFTRLGGLVNVNWPTISFTGTTGNMSFTCPTGYRPDNDNLMPAVILNGVVGISVVEATGSTLTFYGAYNNTGFLPFYAQGCKIYGGNIIYTAT